MATMCVIIYLKISKQLQNLKCFYLDIL